MTPETSIYVIEPFLPWPIGKVCKESGFHTVADLATCSEATWLRVPHIGRKRFAVVRRIVEAAGLHFRREGGHLDLPKLNYDRIIREIHAEYEEEVARIDALPDNFTRQQRHMWKVSAAYYRDDALRAVGRPARRR